MDGSAWDEIKATIDGSPVDVVVLPVSPDSAATCLTALEITTRSWLGAVVANSGGILVDHAWLRVLGSGDNGLPAASPDADPWSTGLTVGYDVLGGQFAWFRAGSAATPTIHYFGPDELAWQDLEQGYSDWLYAMLTGALTMFYDSLRWNGWQSEVAAVALDRGIHTFPPPWSVEGRDLSMASRQVVPLAELVSFHHDAARQLRGGHDG